MEVDLLVHPVGNRMPGQVMLEERQGHDQRHHLLAVVLDEAQEVQPTAGRRCLRSIGHSSGTPSGAGPCGRSHASPAYPSRSAHP